MRCGLVPPPLCFRRDLFYPQMIYVREQYYYFFGGGLGGHISVTGSLTVDKQTEQDSVAAEVFLNGLDALVNHNRIAGRGGGQPRLGLFAWSGIVDRHSLAATGFQRTVWGG